MVHVRPLHIAAAAALGDDAGMIATLDHHAPVSAEVVVHVHAAFGVVQRGDASARPPSKRGAIPGLDGGAAFRGRHTLSAGGRTKGLSTTRRRLARQAAR